MTLQQAIKTTETVDLISADKVRGTNVYDAGGHKLGHIEDVMLHKLDGRVAYAILAFGGFLGLGERFHPLPWGVMRYDVGLEGYVVSLDQGQIEAAPSFTREDIGPGHAHWGETVDAYYRNVPNFDNL